MIPHNELIIRAERWLRARGCGIVIRDPFRSCNQEQPDAIGWRTGVSILVECKSSRADFLADKSKAFRREPARGMGDWRFYMCAPGVIGISDLPAGWGLLHVANRRILNVHGVPPNTRWYTGAPFAGNKTCELTMMYSALRRMELRGHLSEIYDGVITRNEETPHSEIGQKV